MTTATLTPELLASAPGIARRLGRILLAIAALVASAFLKDPRRVALIVPLWTRLTRAARRFAAAMDRAAAGIAPRPSRPGHRGGKPPVVLPTRHAWLVVALRHEAANYASQLNHLLAEPDAAALVAASPQAARILRPICRILGISPACIPPLPRRRPTPSQSAPRPAAPRPTATRAIPAPVLQRATPYAPAPAPLCPRLLDRWPWCSIPAASLT